MRASEERDPSQPCGWKLQTRRADNTAAAAVKLHDLSGDSSSREYRALSPDWPPFYTPYTLADVRGSGTVADGTESVT